MLAPAGSVEPEFSQAIRAFDTWDLADAAGVESAIVSLEIAAAAVRAGGATSIHDCVALSLSASAALGDLIEQNDQTDRGARLRAALIPLFAHSEIALSRKDVPK